MVGLLFLALLFFAFGKADAARNGNQSAADAAALAAAQKSRDELHDAFVANILNGDWLRDVLSGNRIGTFDGCLEAQRFAALNDSDTLQCGWLTDGRWGFSVRVESRKSMGKSILPGTEYKHARSSATAVVEPRCAFVPNPPGGKGNGNGNPPSPSPLPATVGGASGGASGGGASGGNGKGKPPSPGKIACSDRDWVIDPGHLDLLPDMADLFTVRLADN